MKNLKIVSIFIVLVLAFTMLAACGDPITDDLKSYINDKVPAIQTLDTKATDAYNAVAGNNYKDDATMLAAINDTVIPASNSALEAAKKVTPATKEVSALNDQYIAALTSYNSGYLTLKDALTNQDASKADQAKKLLATADTQSADYVAATKALAKDHNLTINMK